MSQYRVHLPAFHRSGLTPSRRELPFNNSFLQLVKKQRTSLRVSFINVSVRSTCNTHQHTSDADSRKINTFLRNTILRSASLPDSEFFVRSFDAFTFIKDKRTNPILVAYVVTYVSKIVARDSSFRVARRITCCSVLLICTRSSNRLANSFLVAEFDFPRAGEAKHR